MAISEQERLFFSLTRISGGSRVYGWDSWLLGQAVTVLRKSALDAEAYVEANRVRVWNAFKARNAEHVRAKHLPAFLVEDELSRLFRVPGPADASSRLDAEVLRDRVDIVRFVDGLNHRQYEYLGAVVAKAVGASHTFVTPSGNEGGVDFYAEIPTWGGSGIFHSPDKKLRVVGQSKYYSDRVGVAKSRELSRVLQDIRHRGINMEGRVPDWFHLAKGPIVGVIVAPFGFQSGLVEDCDQHGIMVADGFDVAHAIAKSRWFRSARASRRTVPQILALALAEAGWAA